MVALMLGASRLSAQERLVGTRSAGAAMSFEEVTFAGAGLSQATFNGLDSTRIKRVRQFTLPVTAAMPLGDRWRIDLTTLYSTGSVTYSDATAASGTRTATLSGISDVRLRATGRVLRDGLIVTVGLNAPTGRTSLSLSEFSALRILSAPALGLGSAPVGSGPSGTLGFVLPRKVGDWAMAFGASYEYRGRYQPIAALTAGSSSADFTPGGVVRASMSADRTIAANRLSVAVAADVFAEDKLKSALADGAAGNGGSGGSQSVASVKLGPVFSADAQMQFAVTRLREFLAYAAYRWRAPFARDGITVDRSSGQYLETGVRAAVPLAAGRDLVLATDARWHSGLGIDLGLPTSGVLSGAASVGLNVRRGLLTLQPYVRVQGGSLTQHTPTVNKPTQGFAGATAGLVFSSRF